MLESERAVYDAHIGVWLQEHANRFVLIKGDLVVGFFNTYQEALIEGGRRFGLTSYLIRPVVAHQQEIHAPALTLGLINATTQSTVHQAGTST